MWPRESVFVLVQVGLLFIPRHRILHVSCLGPFALSFHIFTYKNMSLISSLSSDSYETLPT